MTHVEKALCPTCRHPLVLHSTSGGPCATQKCKCRVPGISPEQAKVLNR